MKTDPEERINEASRSVLSCESFFHSFTFIADGCQLPSRLPISTGLLLARGRALGPSDLAEYACDVSVSLLSAQLDKVLNNPVLDVSIAEIGVTHGREHADRVQGRVECAALTTISHSSCF